MFSRAAVSAARGTAARSFSTAAGRQAAPATTRRVATGVAVAGGLGALALSLSQKPTIQLEGAKTIAGEYKTVSERSFVMIKPDFVSRQLVGKIISRFEERGYKLVAIKSVTPSPELAREHYADLSSKPFFPSLVKYITSGTPVVAMVWEGKDVIRQGRRIVGATNPLESDPGSVRGQYAVSVGRNGIHASDGFDSATKEIGLWFADSELATYEPVAWPM